MNPLADPRWAYFLDVDGTLIDLVPHPADARPSPTARRLLEALHLRAGGALALISGRSLDQLDAILPGFRPAAAGLHGLERRDAAGRRAEVPGSAADLDPIRPPLEAACRRHPGLLLEDKGRTLALHYRQAPRLAGFAHRLARTARADLGPGFELQVGKRVVELRPRGADKGAAVRWMLTTPPFIGRTPVVIGDDRTDEAAFTAARALAGITIKVGPGATHAEWRLADVGAVLAWLDTGAHELRPTRPRASGARR